jgi:hypothetical protein
MTPGSLGSPQLGAQEPRLSLTQASAARFPIPNFLTGPNLVHRQLCCRLGERVGSRTFAYVPRYRPSIPLMTRAKLVGEAALTQYVRLGVMHSARYRGG